jgi:hypothetical protein
VQLDQMIVREVTPGLVFCFRRSSGKIEDPKILQRMINYHELAKQAVIPLLVKNHDDYDKKFAFLNGIQSRTSPPPFGDLNGWTNDYYDWAKVVADAVASSVKNITLIVRSCVDWVSVMHDARIGEQQGQ